MSNYELFAKIGGDSSGLRRAMGNAQKSIGITSGSLRKLAAVGVTAFKGLAVSAGGAVGSLALLTRSGLDFVDSQTKLARSLKTSTESLRAVQLAASEGGLENLDMAVVRLNRRLGAAEQGIGEYKRTIDALNLSAVELQNVPLDERLAMIADAVQESGLSMQQAARHAQTLGFEQANAAAFFMQGGDAIRENTRRVRAFGVAFSQIEGISVERAQDAMAQLAFIFEGIRIELASQLAPLLESAANHIMRMGEEAGGFRAIAKPAVDAVIDAIGILGDGLIKVQRAFLEVKLAIQLMMIDFERFKSVADFLNPLSGTIQALKGAFGGLSEVVGDTNEEVQATKDAIDNLAKEGAFSAWIRARQAENDLLVESLSKVPPLLRRMDTAPRATPSGETQGVVGPQIFPDFIPDYIKDFGKLKDAAEQASIDITTFMEQAGSNIQTAFADFLFNPFEDGLKGMLKSFVNIINRMVAEIAAAQILGAFFGQFAGQSGIMGQMASGMGIEPPTAPSRPGMATGGPITARRPYMVGEKGPEMIVPSKSSYVVPNNKLGGGGGMNLSVTVNAEDPGAEGRIRTMVERELAPQIIEAATGRTLNQLSRPRFA